MMILTGSLGQQPQLPSKTNNNTKPATEQLQLNNGNSNSTTTTSTATTSTTATTTENDNHNNATYLSMDKINNR
jgi:hypothetical protein